MSGNVIYREFDLPPKDEEAAEERRLRFNSICPLIYRATDPSLIPNRKLFEHVVMEWQCGDWPQDDTPPAWGCDKPGLLLCGPAGIGKTRTMYALLRQHILGWGADAIAYRGTEFARLIVQKALHGGLEDFLAELTADAYWYLFLDDFDKIKFTPKVSECLYEVFEARFSGKLSILLTVNSTGAALEKKIGPEYGPAIVRRIRDFCTAVEFRS